MMTRALCIHGHFYQPPREDPLTGTVPREVGAAPYRNWNERIHAECYRANSRPRQLRADQLQRRPNAFHLDGAARPQHLSP